MFMYHGFLWDARSCAALCNNGRRRACCVNGGRCVLQLAILCSRATVS